MLNHLIELRKRALWILISFIAFFFSFFLISSDLFSILVKPLLKALPPNSHLIATQITAAVFTPVKLAFNLALLATTPIALYHIWHFTAPGLYQQERSTLRLTILFSSVLFITGVMFCFYVVLPFMFQFFAKALPQSVSLFPDMAYSIDFITRMLLLFGLSFQLPLLCITLVRLELASIENLQTLRPYFIVMAFTLGMLLTPPDVFSQLILALPLCLLYELGILSARLLRIHGSKKSYELKVDSN